MRTYLAELLNRIDLISPRRNLIAGIFIGALPYAIYRLFMFTRDHYQEAFLWLIYLLIK
jgi:hypothetical protein